MCAINTHFRRNATDGDDSAMEFLITLYYMNNWIVNTNSNTVYGYTSAQTIKPLKSPSQLREIITGKSRQNQAKRTKTSKTLIPQSYSHLIKHSQKKKATRVQGRISDCSRKTVLTLADLIEYNGVLFICPNSDPSLMSYKTLLWEAALLKHPHRV